MARLQQDNEQDQAANLEEQLRQQQERNIKDHIEAMEEIFFDPNNEFNTKECVVCIDDFQAGQDLLRIPSCRHFFHKKCCREWYESQKQQDYQRCPQCNIILKLEELKKMKEENEKNKNINFYVSPITKSSKHSKIHDANTAELSMIKSDIGSRNKMNPR